MKKVPRTRTNVHAEAVDKGDDVAVSQAADGIERITAVLFAQMNHKATACAMGIDGRFKLILVARTLEALIRILRHNDAAAADALLSAHATMQGKPLDYFTSDEKRRH